MDVCELQIFQPPSATQIGIGVHRQGHQRFCLADRWCLHLYTYHAQLKVDGIALDVFPGCAGLTPPGAVAAYDFQAPSCVHVFAHFRVADVASGLVSLPLMQDLGARFESINQALLEAVGWFPTNPERANARLWDVLWRLMPEGTNARQEPVSIERARHFIERNIARPIVIPNLAKHAGCSHNHLLRLFQTQFGTSVVGFIRRRRAERAAYLLRNSILPIKLIPGQIGIADVQSLNKLMRRELGLSPRELRRGHGDSTVAH